MFFFLLHIVAVMCTSIQLCFTDFSLMHVRYEPYLWENERQAYLRHAVLFGFFVQLNRIHMDAAQKLPTNPESNIMRCSVVPRFKYLPISCAPALSVRNAARTSISASVDDDVYSRNS